MSESKSMPISNLIKGEILLESIKLENLINSLKENWKIYPTDECLGLQYISLGVFYAEIQSDSVSIINIYTNKPKIEEFDKLTEIFKNLLAALYFLVEEMLKREISELKTVSTNLKMAKSLKRICNKGEIKVCTKIKDLETNQIKKEWQYLGEIDFSNLDENLQLGKSFENMTATFECQVDQNLLEHLKTKITKLYKKELSKL